MAFTKCSFFFFFFFFRPNTSTTRTIPASQTAHIKEGFGGAVVAELQEDSKGSWERGFGHERNEGTRCESDQEQSEAPTRKLWPHNRTRSRDCAVFTKCPQRPKLHLCIALTGLFSGFEQNLGPKETIKEVKILWKHEINIVTWIGHLHWPLPVNMNANALHQNYKGIFKKHQRKR